MKGLRDRHIVERLVREGYPNTFSQAMLLVQEYEADYYRLHLTLDKTVEGPQEEPMEVNAFNQPPKLPHNMAKPSTPSNETSLKLKDKWWD